MRHAGLTDLTLTLDVQILEQGVHGVRHQGGGHGVPQQQRGVGCAPGAARPQPEEAVHGGLRC